MRFEGLFRLAGVAGAMLGVTVTPPGNPPPELLHLALFGTDAPDGTVALFGHPFPKGVLRPTEGVLLRLPDSGKDLPTQMNPVTSWPDGSVKVALLAVACPALPRGGTQECILIRAPVSAQPPLDLAKALEGRTAHLTIRPATGEPWTFDLVAAARTSTDRWHQGPLAVSTRVETRVPSHVVGATSVRLVADVIVTRDGILEIDWRLANDAYRKVGGGRAVYGYSVAIDGEEVYAQNVTTQLQYTAWVRQRGRARGGPMCERPCVRPDYDALVQGGFTLPWDRSLPSQSFGGYIERTIAEWSRRANDPYPTWGIHRQASQVGGRQEIGTPTPTCVGSRLEIPARSFWPTGNWRWASRGRRTIGTRSSRHG